MPWKLIGIYTLRNDWVLTPPVIGEVFRIQHLPIYNPDDKYIKAVFAQAFYDTGLNLFEPKRLSYRTEPEVFIHYFPTGISQRQLAFKRLDDNTTIFWRIKAEVFSSGNLDDDLANLMLTRIRNIMTIYARGSAGLTPASGEVPVQADTPLLLIRANDKRQMVVIRTSDAAVKLYAGLDEQGSPVGMIESLEPNETYEFPAEQGIYRGDIYAVASVDTRVNYTQYSA